MTTALIILVALLAICAFHVYDGIRARQKQIDHMPNSIAQFRNMVRNASLELYYKLPSAKVMYIHHAEGNARTESCEYFSDEDVLRLMELTGVKRTEPVA